VCQLANAAEKVKKLDCTTTKFTSDLDVGVKFAGIELQADYDGFVGDNPSAHGLR